MKQGLQNPTCTATAMYHYGESAGAIFGIGGALAVFFYRHKEFFGERSDAILRELGQNLAINLAYGLVVSNINNW